MISQDSNNASDAQNGALLTLKEIASRLGVTYARLRGFAEADGMSACLGAVRVPGSKGVRYPGEAQSAFGYLIVAQDHSLVTPKTATAFLKRYAEKPPAGESSTIGLLSQESNLAQLDELIAALRALTSALADQPALDPPEDRVLTRPQAAELLACAPRAVGRYVKAIPGRRGFYRRREVLRAIQRGGEAGEP